MIKFSVFEWYKQFKEGCKNVEDGEDRTHHFHQIKGIVHFEFLPQGQTVNQAYSVEILK
jgi:hypothetical protein